MIHFFHLSTASTKQMSTLSHSEVICMQKPQTDMKPGFKKQMFLPFKASVGKAQSSRSVIQPAAAAELHRASELTVMTDTPAEVLLSLGPVLKCFLIFPATDNWFSFSDAPSSWETQANVSAPSFTCMFRCDSGVLNLHWPTDDRAPAWLCTSDPPPPAASQWSQPRKTWHVGCNHVFSKTSQTVYKCKTSKHQPWHCQTHCPSKVLGNQAGPAKSAGRELPGHRRCCCCCWIN